MLTWGDDVEVHALKARGWSISAIARHLERDRKTVRSYLNGGRQPGVRVTVVVDPLADFEVYGLTAGDRPLPHPGRPTTEANVLSLLTRMAARQQRQKALSPLR